MTVVNRYSVDNFLRGPILDGEPTVGQSFDFVLGDAKDLCIISSVGVISCEHVHLARPRAVKRRIW